MTPCAHAVTPCVDILWAYKINPGMFSESATEHMGRLAFFTATAADANTALFARGSSEGAASCSYAAKGAPPWCNSCSAGA